MATIRENMAVLIENDCPTTLSVIDYLVRVRQVASMEDDIETLYYYLQPRFQKKLLEYVEEYQNSKRGVGA